VRHAALVYPAGQPRLTKLATELGFEVAVSAADASQARATKTLHPENDSVVPVGLPGGV